MHGVSCAQPARGAGLCHSRGPQPALPAALAHRVPCSARGDTHTAPETALTADTPLAAFAFLLGCPRAWRFSLSLKKWKLQVKFVLCLVQGGDRTKETQPLFCFQYFSLAANPENQLRSQPYVVQNKVMLSMTGVMSGLCGANTPAEAAFQVLPYLPLYTPLHSPKESHFLCRFVLKERCSTLREYQLFFFFGTIVLQTGLRWSSANLYTNNSELIFPLILGLGREDQKEVFQSNI